MPTYNKHIFVRPKKVWLYWDLEDFVTKVYIYRLEYQNWRSQALTKKNKKYCIKTVGFIKLTLPKNLKISPALHIFSQIIKKWVLSDLMLNKYRLLRVAYSSFRNPPILKIVTFLTGQKGCDYFVKRHHFGCGYYE